MSTKGDWDRTTNKAEYDKRYSMIAWGKNEEHTLCPHCAGELVEKMVEDEVYKICQDCGSLV